MTVVAHPEILTSLGSIREDVKRQVAGLDRYRALKAIEQTIADFPGLEDVSQSLADVRDRVQRQLDETREYRALRTIERIMPELSDVLELLSVPGASASQSAPNQGPDDTLGEVGETDPSRAAMDLPPADQSVEGSAFSVLATVGETSPPERPATSFDRMQSAVTGSEAPVPCADFESEPVPRAETPPGSSLAYSLSQMVVQGRVPPPRESTGPEADPLVDSGVSDHPPRHAERAA